MVVATPAAGSRSVQQWFTGVVIAIVPVASAPHDRTPECWFCFSETPGQKPSETVSESLALHRDKANRSEEVYENDNGKATPNSSIIKFSTLSSRTLQAKLRLQGLSLSCCYRRTDRQQSQSDETPGAKAKDKYRKEGLRWMASRSKTTVGSYNIRNLFGIWFAATQPGQKQEALPKPKALS